MLYYIWLKCGRANKPEAMGGQSWLWQTSPRGILDQLLLKRSAGSTTKSSQVLKTYFFHQLISRDIFFFGLGQDCFFLYRVCELECLDCWSGKVSPGAFSWTCENRSTAFICPKIKPRFTLTICHDILLSGWYIAGRWPSEANSIHSGSGDGPD